MPHGKKNGKKTYDPRQILDWKVEQAKQQAREAYSDSDMVTFTGDAAGDEQLERYRKARADMVEFDLKVKRKLYLEIDEVRATFRKAAGLISVGMQAIGKKLSIKLSKEANPNHCQEMVDGEINKVLDELSRVRFSEHDDVIDEMIDEKAAVEPIDLVES